MIGQGCLRRWPFIGFCGLAFAWSWTCWLLSPAVKPQAPWFATLLMFAGGFGPSAAAVAVVRTLRGRAGLRTWLWRCLKWKVGRGWMALVFVAPLAVVSIAAGVDLALGGTIAPSPAVGHVPLCTAKDDSRCALPRSHLTSLTT